MNTHEKVQSNINSLHSVHGLKIAALYFHKLGYKVYTPEFKENAPTKEDIEKYSDQGDILTVSRIKNEIVIIEVKRLTASNMYANFTDGSIFQHKAVIVDGRYQFDRKIIRPALYFCLNYPCTHCFMVKVDSTRTYWYVAKGNGNYSAKQYYFCPIKVGSKQLVTFKAVTDMLPINEINKILQSDEKQLTFGVW